MGTSGLKSKETLLDSTHTTIYAIFVRYLSRDDCLQASEFYLTVNAWVQSQRALELPGDLEG